MPRAGDEDANEPAPAHPPHRNHRVRPLPAAAARPGVRQRRAPPLRAAGEPRPRRGDDRRDSRARHHPAGARIRRRRAPLRAGPAQGPHGRRRDAAAGRRPRAQGGMRLRLEQARDAALDLAGAGLHEPPDPPRPRRGPVPPAPARRRTRGARSDSLEAGQPARADAARGLLGGPLAGGAVHRARTDGAALMASALDPAVREGVIALARDAGAAIMQVYAQDFDVEHKDDRSPLTQADLAAHRIIAAGLAKLTPEIPLLSEESVERPWEIRRKWRRYWLVDPLDGTREFVKKNGEFTVNIALIDEHAPVFGVVQTPALDELHWAQAGVGAFIRNGNEDVALSVRRPATAPLRVAASRSHLDERTAALLKKLGEI